MPLRIHNFSNVFNLYMQLMSFHRWQPLGHRERSEEGRRRRPGAIPERRQRHGQEIELHVAAFGHR